MLGDRCQGGNRALMATGSQVVCHPRERGDPEGAVFQAWRTKEKYQSQPDEKKPFPASHNKLKRNGKCSKESSRQHGWRELSYYSASSL